MRIVRYIFVGVLMAVSLSSCGNDGSEPYALWSRYSHPDGDFSFHYLAPPWTRHGDSTQIHPVMTVHTYSEATSGGLGARMRLEAWSEENEMALDVAFARYDYWLDEGYEVEGVDDFVNTQGDEGFAIVAEWDGHHVREVIYASGEGCVVLSLWTHGDRYESDVDLLVNSFRSADAVFASEQAAAMGSGGESDE